jgi:hypothetical protein
MLRSLARSVGFPYAFTLRSCKTEIQLVMENGTKTPYTPGDLSLQEGISILLVDNASL